MLPTLLVFAGISAAQAQTPYLDGHRIPIRTDTFASYLVRGSDTVRTGTVIDAVTSDGRELTRIYTTTDRVLGTDLDTIVDRLDDLAPVRYHGRQEETLTHVDYDDSTASGWIRTANGDSVTVHVALPHPIFGGTSFDLVARAADLRVGSTLRIEAFLESDRAIAPLEGKVTAEESVDGHTCWVFEGIFTSIPVTFWIDERTRVLRQQEMHLPQGVSWLLSLRPITPTRSQRAS